MGKKYEFAILKQILNSKEEQFTPVTRIWNRYIPSKWQRIVKIYDVYLLQDLDFMPPLSYTECEEHILGYQNVLRKNREKEIKLTELHKLEKKTF